MIEPTEFVTALGESGVTFFTGVPDSLLKHFNEAVVRTSHKNSHIVAANEGSAVALATGHYIATGRPGLVYLQNSGLGNTVNPLLSLVSPALYGIPAILLIGWRGEPGVADEPQHSHQGEITESLLETLGVPMFRLTAESDSWLYTVREAVDTAVSSGRSVALLVSKGTFRPLPKHESGELPWSRLSREEALGAILDILPDDALLVATTGYTGRELDFARGNREEPRDHDFLVVGSMGHAASIALGLAVGRPERDIVCLDGDGSVTMHMGSLAQNGRIEATNLVHVVLNNRAHESVGGQPSVADSADLPGIARACGYRMVDSVDDLESLRSTFEEHLTAYGPSFIEVRIHQGAPEDLPRPSNLKDRIGALRKLLDG